MKFKEIIKEMKNPSKKEINKLLELRAILIYSNPSGIIHKRYQRFHDNFYNYYNKFYDKWGKEIDLKSNNFWKNLDIQAKKWWDKQIIKGPGKNW